MVVAPVELVAAELVEAEPVAELAAVELVEAEPVAVAPAAGVSDPEKANGEFGEFAQQI
jgi:hypothetical protein